MRDPERFRDASIAVLGIVFSLIVLFIWIPNDIETGVLDTWRRTVRIGDAMLPTFAALGILLASLGVLLQSFLKTSRTPYRQTSLVFISIITAILLFSVILMLFVGPLAVSVWSAGEIPYRQVLDSFPWKYLGFISGGTVLIFSLISLSTRKFQWCCIGLALLITLFMALIYDLPFDTLMLPPNGDY